MIVISIDPSINDCGFAIHDTTANGHGLLVHTLLHPSKTDKEYYEKSKTLFNLIRGITNEFKNDEHIIVLETPEYWKVAGHAARESGSVFKLTFLCGMIYSLDNVVTTTPSGWKKQMPKDVVNRRLRSVYNDINIEKTNHNIVDAIGIGHWYITNYIKDKHD